MPSVSPLLTFLDTVLPNASPAKGLILKEEFVGGRITGIQGEDKAETELGKVSFTKPVAFQEINGKRIEVDVESRIQEPEAGSQNTEEQLSQLVYDFTVASYDTTKDLVIDPLLASPSSVNLMQTGVILSPLIQGETLCDRVYS